MCLFKLTHYPGWWHCHLPASRCHSRTEVSMRDAPGLEL